MNGTRTYGGTGIELVCWNQALLRQLVQGIELRQAVRTVVHAGVLVDKPQSPGIEPQLVLHNWSANCSHAQFCREKGGLGWGAGLSMGKRAFSAAARS